MKLLILTLALLFTLPTEVNAQELNEYLWKSRLVLCFTPSPGDPLFEQQFVLLQNDYDAFEERDVIFIFITPDGKLENTGLFPDEAKSHQLYNKFSVNQQLFELVLIGYDGHEKFRACNRITPSSVPISLIDGMPMRQRELLQGYGNQSQVGEKTKNPSGGRRKF